jgi:hypothetical protein
MTSKNYLNILSCAAKLHLTPSTLTKLLEVYPTNDKVYTALKNILERRKENLNKVVSTGQWRMEGSILDCVQLYFEENSTGHPFWTFPLKQIPRIFYTLTHLHLSIIRLPSNNAHADILIQDTVEQ